MKSNRVLILALLQACLFSDSYAAADINPGNQSSGAVTVTRTSLSGIGQEKGVMRRDPSDIIKVGVSLSATTIRSTPKSFGRY